MAAAAILRALPHGVFNGPTLFFGVRFPYRARARSTVIFFRVKSGLKRGKSGLKRGKPRWNPPPYLTAKALSRRPHKSLHCDLGRRRVLEAVE